MEAPDSRRRRTASTKIASTGNGQPRRAASTGAGRGTESPGATEEQPSEVAGKASTEAGMLLEEARRRLEQRAAVEAQWVAARLRSLGDQGVALAGGRPQDAPEVGDLVRRAADKLLEAADIADTLVDVIALGAIGGFLDDIGGVVRRRPGLLVLMAAAVLAAMPVARPVGAPAEGKTDEQDGSVHDQLERAAVDALLRAIWPRDVDERSRRDNRQRSAGSSKQRQVAVRPKKGKGADKEQRERGAGSVTGPLAKPARHSAKPAKKTAARAARAATGGARASLQSVTGQVGEARAAGGDEPAEVSRRSKEERETFSKVAKTAKRAGATTTPARARTRPAVETSSTKGTSAARSESARRRGPRPLEG